MPEIELTAGTIEYEDTGGDGPVLVLLGGLVMDGSVWDPLVADLRRDHRCVVPTLPLGAHRKAMHPDADLSLHGFARMVAELLERLALSDVTLVQNDHAAALVLAGENPDRVARLVISSCEAFENYPPGLPGKNVRLTAFVPGGIFLTMQALRIRALRRLPIAFGWMAKHPLPDELLDRWFAPLQRQRAVRRDLRKYVTGPAAPADGRGVRTPARIHAAGARRVDAGGQSAAPRARPSLRGAAGRLTPPGDRRQLHADHARPAAAVRAGDPRVRARDGRGDRAGLASPRARGQLGVRG
jgi:pimeloyl-ACP methyl ester carboxylesterase